MERHFFEYVCLCISIIFEVLLWLTFTYYLVISTFGWMRRKELLVELFPIKNKFAIIISAHNEELVIGGAIRSLKALKYPKEMYDIFVIADNCTDNTAKVAKETGAKVFERFDRIKRGKGHSLEWMFKKLFEFEKQYDAICILDADNLVSSNYLLEMNKQLCLGNKVIQGYLDSKNPKDSWISGNYSISYWMSNRLFQLPRHYLGLSCALGGTGFVMSHDVLKQIGWEATCLTEDLEFSIRLVLKNMRVSWAHDAIVYDEKPLKLAQSWRQRKRWMQGHCDCASRFFWQLLKKAIKDMDIVALDSAMYLLQPLIIVINGIGLLGGIFNLIFITRFNELITLNTVLLGLLLFVLTYINIVFVFIEGKFFKKNRKVLHNSSIL